MNHQQLNDIKAEIEVNRVSMEQIEREASDKIDELGAIKQDAQETAGELEEYTISLDGLVATIEQAERVIDEAQGQGIDI